MVKQYYIKGVHRVKKPICSQMFYKVVVLESYAKSQENMLESLFNKVAGIKRVHHSCFPMKCFFLINP